MTSRGTVAGEVQSPTEHRSPSEVNAGSSRSKAIPSERVAAVDMARGYMMFIQISHGIVLAGLAPFVSSENNVLFRQLAHAEWHGMTYLDLGFPGYILIMGMAIHLVLNRMKESGSSGRELLRPIAIRTVLLFVLGIICNGGFTEPWPDVRVAGVLQRLAICYGAACLVAWNLGWRAQIGLLGSMLLGYWAVMQWVPFPGATVDRYSGDNNLAAYLDIYLPGRPLYGSWDPEGLLTTFPSIATCIAGVVLGRIFLHPLSHKQKVTALCLIGVSAMILGKLWGTWFPINKYMWTSSFVLASGGAVTLHVALFYVVGDIYKLQKLIAPLMVYGRNSLTAYVGVQLIPFDDIGRRVVGGSVAAFFGRWSGLVLALVVIAIEWGLLFWLDKRRRHGELRPERRG